MVAYLMTALSLLLAADAERDAAVEKGLRDFRGTWTPVSMEMDGKFLSLDRLKKVRLTIDGEKFTFETGDDSHDGLYKIDPAKNPRELNIEVTRGDEKGKVYFVIYKFENGKMIQCMHVDNERRPTQFTGKAGSKNLYEVWRRVK